MSEKRKRPRQVRGRAPWRWRWGRILLIPVHWTVWALALWWSPFFGIALSFYLYAQLRAGYSEPLPSPTAGKGLNNEEAGQGLVFTQDPDQPNHWKVTHSE